MYIFNSVNNAFYFYMPKMNAVFISGNSNLIYTIIRKRHVFHALASLATDSSSINRSLMKKSPLIKRPSKGKFDLIKDKSSSPTINPSASSSLPAIKKERKPSLAESTTSQSSQLESPSMEGSQPALPAEPGTLKVSLATIPGETIM